jgi:hypothetical protein
MAIVRIKGILTAEGEIKVDLPENWQPGEIEILIPSNETVWTDEELAELEELMKPEPVPASEIVMAEEIGSWSDIEDSVAFVEELRRKRRERNQW